MHADADYDADSDADECEVDECEAVALRQWHPVKFMPKLSGTVVAMATRKQPIIFKTGMTCISSSKIIKQEFFSNFSNSENNEPEFSNSVSLRNANRRKLSSRFEKVLSE
ncbi:MAG: hypothetical protein V2I33_21120 [Kangiellaceae bacterium]|nr:hypothetical protein [Kangiellaceae bacterium]